MDEQRIWHVANCASGARDFSDGIRLAALGSARTANWSALTPVAELPLISAKLGFRAAPAGVAAALSYLLPSRLRACTAFRPQEASPLPLPTLISNSTTPIAGRFFSPTENTS